MTDPTITPPAAPNLAAGFSNTASVIPPVPPVPGAASPAPDPGPVTAGQIAYEAYGDHRQWIAFNGEPIPRWTEALDDIKAAWHYAAAAIHRDVAGKITQAVAGVRALAAAPGAELPTPTGTTPDAVTAVTSWFGHFVAEAERAEQTVRSWLTPAALRAGEDAARAVENVIRSL